jgi:epoxide hydrolase-like predicted phosphatase
MALLALDLGGVVYRSWPDEAFHLRWAQTCGFSPEALVECLWQTPHWGQAEIGEITADECYARAAERLGVTQEVARALVFDAFASAPDEALAAYVGTVRKRGVVVAALTNNMSGEAELLRRPELGRLFDAAISSVDARLAKPDPGFFRHAEARLGAAGRDVIFVDDMPGNVEAARDLGWRAIHFRSTAQAIQDIEAALAGASA